MERARDNGAARGPVRLLSVGRLAQVKGQAVLLRALRELRDRGIPFEATIVGDGPKRADLVRLASELDIQDQVEFTGAIGQDRIRWYYANSDIFCLSSFAEGVPVVLMEAMATGLPVVAPAVMGVAELVEDGLSGSLIRPGRADLLADAVQRLVEDPAARVALGEQGRRKVVEEFDIGASADALLELYSSHTN
jgi:colanic acid/amylovoran biosynthesis glycosyltransferase